MPARSARNASYAGAFASALLAAALVLALLATGVVAAAGSAAALRPVESQRVLIAVYRGPAIACPGCTTAVVDLLRRDPAYDVVTIGPAQPRHLDAAGLRGVDLLAMPGGNGSVAHAVRALGRRTGALLRRWVAHGGHYVGFCLGAYLAGSDPGFGLLGPGDTGEWDRTRGAAVRDAREAVVRVRWFGPSGGRVRWQYVQDPPYVVPSGVPGERVLARFGNGRVDALVRPRGRGAVGVVGTHPEADRSWYTRRLWRTDRDGLDFRQGLALVRATLES